MTFRLAALGLPVIAWLLGLGVAEAQVVRPLSGKVRFDFGNLGDSRFLRGRPVALPTAASTGSPPSRGRASRPSVSAGRSGSRAASSRCAARAIRIRRRCWA